MVLPSLRGAVISAEHPVALFQAIVGDAHAPMRAAMHAAMHADAREHVDRARVAFNRTSLASRP